MKVVDCPVFAAGDSPANGELEPYACPLIYCGERPYGQGNLSFFMCEKRVIENDSKQTQYFDRRCEGAYELCETNCTYIKSNEVWAKFAAKDVTFDNATRYATIGCAEGDLSTGDYKSSEFPSLSIVQKKMHPYTNVIEELPLPSSSNRLCASLPWLLLITLLSIYCLKKIQ